MTSEGAVCAAESDSAVAQLLVRIPNWVGDAVMATPALRAIRRAHPHAHLTALGRRAPLRALSGNPSIDEIWPIARREEKQPRALLRFVGALREKRFSAAFLLTNSFGSALPLALARIPMRVGYRGEGRGRLLTHAGPYAREGRRRSPMPMPLYYQGVLDLVGITPAGTTYEVPRHAASYERVARWLAEIGAPSGADLGVLNPGAAFGASKRWPEEAFARLGERFVRERGAVPIVLGGPGEEELVGRIVSGAREPLIDGTRPVLPLEDLGALMRRARVVVSTDSGPRHIAVGVGAPVVALIGPTDRRWTDWELANSRVLTHSVPCGPCHLSRCPLDHACMEGISVERVWQAVSELWPQPPESE